MNKTMARTTRPIATLTKWAKSVPTSSIQDVSSRSHSWTVSFAGTGNNSTEMVESRMVELMESRS